MSHPLLDSKKEGVEIPRHLHIMTIWLSVMPVDEQAVSPEG